MKCRAKAGGKQSSKDATGKYAKSAGSQIRRYNEVMPDSMQGNTVCKIDFCTFIER